MTVQSVDISDDSSNNEWADFWFYEGGVNVIPAIGLEKLPIEKWTRYQNEAIPPELHEYWKRSGRYSKGFGKVMGIVWRGKKEGWNITGIDADNPIAIIEICTRDGKITQLSDKTLVEERIDKDGKKRWHIYVYSEKPIANKSSDMSIKGTEIKADKMPAVEVKGSSQFLMFGVPNNSKDGTKYRIPGAKEITALNELQRHELEQHINNICKKYGLKYLELHNGNGKGLIPMSELSKGDTIIHKGHNRHISVLRKIESFIKLNPNTPLEEIKEWAALWNKRHCDPPLDDREFEEQWKAAINWKPIQDAITAGKDKGNGDVDVDVEPPEEVGIKLDDKVIKGLCSLFSEQYFEEDLLYKIFAFFRKHGISLASCISIIDTITTDEEKRRCRRNVLEQIFNGTYPDLDSENITSKYLFDSITSFCKKPGIVKKVFTPIIKCVIQEEDPVIWLTNILMEENKFATMDDSDDIYYYNGKGIFVEGGNILIKKQIEQMFPSATTYGVNEVMNHIRRSTYVSRSDFDSNSDILTTENCTLNIHTLERKPHSPDYLSLVKIPVGYNAEAKCPLIEQYFDQALHPEDIPVVKQMIGYCLYKTWKYQKSFLLFGRSGSNGKGVMLDVIEALVGRTNCSHRSLQDLDINRFAIADLHGKMVNTFGDLKKTKLLETGNFKVMSAGDAVTGEHKFGQPFEFRNYAKMLFSANLIPESEDKTDAYYRRWVIIQFDKRFANGKEDAELALKLTTPEELSGLLNLALAGLKDLVAAGGFHDKTIEEIKQEYEENTNDVNAFLIRECIVNTTNEEYRTLKPDLYAAYVNFCKSRKVLPFDDNVFGRELAKHGIHNVRHNENGELGHYYDGVILRSSLRKADQTSL